MSVFDSLLNRDLADYNRFEKYSIGGGMHSDRMGSDHLNNRKVSSILNDQAAGSSLQSSRFMNDQAGALQGGRMDSNHAAATRLQNDRLRVCRFRDSQFS